MKKAKEYFEEWKSKPLSEQLNYVIEVLQKIIHESDEIAEMRNTNTVRAYQAIFKEQNRKANSFIRKVNEVTEYKIAENSMWLVLWEIDKLPDKDLSYKVIPREFIIVFEKLEKINEKVA